MARWCAVGASLVALGLLAAGCGSSSKSAASAPATTTPTTTTTRSGAFQSFQSCLKAHGVSTLPFRFRRPAGRRPLARRPLRRPVPAKDRQAFQACRSKLPAGGGFFGRGRFGGPRGARNPAFARYTACLAKHGVKFGAASPGSATFRKAQMACASLLPTRPPTTTGGSTA